MSDKKLCTLIGAGPGMGLAIARRFGQEGFRVALMARRQGSLDELTAELTSEGIEARGFVLDVTDPASMDEAFSALRAEMGEPDVLVYNAAVAPPSLPSALDADTLQATLKVNVTGALLAAQQVLPAMRSRDHGTLILTGGGLALYPNAQMTALSIGKSALRSLAFCLASELDDTHVRARTVTICGFVKPDTHFSPDRIAESFWDAHADPDSGPELRYE